MNVFHSVYDDIHTLNWLHTHWVIPVIIFPWDLHFFKAFELVAYRDVSQFHILFPFLSQPCTRLSSIVTHDVYINKTFLEITTKIMGSQIQMTYLSSKKSSISCIRESFVLFAIVANHLVVALVAATLNLCFLLFKTRLVLVMELLNSEAFCMNFCVVHYFFISWLF